MIARRITGASRLTDLLALHYGLPNRNQIGFIVAISSFVAVSMIDDDKVSVTGYVSLEANNRDLSVACRRVPYDIERATQAIEASDMPNEYAEMLRTGSG